MTPRNRDSGEFGERPDPAPIPAIPETPGSAEAQAALDASLEGATVLDRGGYPYLVHPLLDGVPRCPPLLLEAWTRWAARDPLCQAATVLLAPEAMALPLVAPLATATGLPYSVARKRRYGLPGERVAQAATGYGEAALHLNGLVPGDRVLVVDNVLSTGGTLGALLAALKAMGCTPVGALVAINKGTARERLEQAHGAPIHALRTIRVEAGRVRIVARG